MVRRRREQRHLTSLQLAERIGASDGWVRQVELGLIKRPGREKLTRLATELELDPSDLLAASDQLGALIEVRELAGVPWTEMMGKLDRIITLLEAQNGTSGKASVHPRTG